MDKDRPISASALITKLAIAIDLVGNMDVVHGASDGSIELLELYKIKGRGGSHKLVLAPAGWAPDYSTESLFLQCLHGWLDQQCLKRAIGFDRHGTPCCGTCGKHGPIVEMFGKDNKNVETL